MKFSELFLLMPFGRDLRVKDSVEWQLREQEMYVDRTQIHDKDYFF
jgi:hypothetical protein